MKARFVHLNLTAQDWRRLARFYCEVFGCVPKPPERNHAGRWLDDLTALTGARVTGLHLRLPGFDADGPTLEIFSYDEMRAANLPVANEPGFGHIAFAVDDVDAALDEVIAAGGSSVGRVCSTVVSGVGTLHVVYARDPEGNIVELQRWT